MSRINSQIILVGSFGVFITTLILNYYLSQPTELKAVAMPIIPNPTTTLTQEKNEETIYIHPASDDSKELILQTKKLADNQTRYTLSTKIKDQDQKTEIIQFLLDNDTKIEIPFNAWSTDNQYFFVKQIAENNTKFLVFQAEGQKFQDQQFIDLNNAFAQRATGYELDQATGWANANLLIVTTKQTDQSAGPKYWFVAANQRFLN